MLPSVATQVYGSWQTELKQLRPAAQRVPHAPQFIGSLCVFAQVPEQFVAPEAQGIVQPPITQLSPDGHMAPQARQFRESFCKFTQVLLQLEKPALQVTLHEPIAQVAVPFVGVSQALLHEPQCAVLVRVSTHIAPQVMLGAMQTVVAVHMPLTQR